MTGNHSWMIDEPGRFVEVLTNVLTDTGEPLSLEDVG